MSVVVERARGTGWESHLGCTGGGELVFEADVKGGVGVGGKSHSSFASYIFRFSVFVSNGIFDLVPVSGCIALQVFTMQYVHAC